MGTTQKALDKAQLYLAHPIFNLTIFILYHSTNCNRGTGLAVLLSDKLGEKNMFSGIRACQAV